MFLNNDDPTIDSSKKLNGLIVNINVFFNGCIYNYSSFWIQNALRKDSLGAYYSYCTQNV